MRVVASRTAVLYQTVLRAQTSTPKSQPKVIRDLKLDFQITLDPDPDVCHLPDRSKKVWIYYFIGVSHFAECRENRPVTMRSSNKSPKIPDSAMVREVEN